MSFTKSFEIQNIKDTFEVVVVGGGTAGALSAIAAARMGKKVAVVEQFGALGGSATMALVTPLMPNFVEGEPDNSSISAEITARLEKRGFAGRMNNHIFFDPLQLAYVLEEMFVEENITIFYYTRLVDVCMEGEKILSLILHDKEGLKALSGEVFVDATGDGDLSVLSHADFNKGNPKTGKNQPISVRYLVSNIDLDAFYESAPDSIWRERFSYYGDCTSLEPKNSLQRIMKKGLDDGELTKEDLYYWQFFSFPGQKGTLAFNCPEIFEHTDGTKAFDLTNAQIMGKKAIFRQLAFYKKHFVGFENAYVAQIAPMVGIRETREIITEKVLTFEEARRFTKFDEGIAQTNYPIDVHGAGDIYSNEHLESDGSQVPYFEVPFSCLVVKNVDNLFVTGRCVGCEFLVQASIRVQQTARAMGEAAGIGAALCAEGDKIAKHVAGKKVRAIMIENGAQFC